MSNDQSNDDFACCCCLGILWTIVSVIVAPILATILLAIVAIPYYVVLKTGELLFIIFIDKNTRKIKPWAIELFSYLTICLLVACIVFMLWKVVHVIIDKHNVVQDAKLAQQAQNVKMNANQGAAALQVGKFNGAAGNYRVAAAGYETILKQAHTEKSIATYTKSLAICYQGLAFALKNLNQFPQSEQALITVLDMEKRDQPFKLDPDDKAETYSQLGMLYFDWMKQTRNNPNLLNKSLNSMNLAVQSVQGSNESRYRSFLGNSLIHRGDMERQEGLLAKAEQDYKDAINAAPHDSHVVQLAQQRLNEMFNKVIDEILK